MNTAQPEYVGFWARFGASLVDSILMGIILVPIGRLFVVGGDLESAFRLDSPANIAMNGILPAIAVILFWMYRQATPGKMAISARVVDAKTGGTLGVGQSIVRYLGYFVSTIPLGLGLLWVAFDPKKQGWHDKIAGTVVVRERGAVRG